jgi:hypothetical protein
LHAIGTSAPASAKSCSLKPVSFIKPIDAENEHPGYPSGNIGSQHETAAIVATLERRYGAAPLGTRDAQVDDLGSIFEARELRR